LSSGDKSRDGHALALFCPVVDIETDTLAVIPYVQETEASLLTASARTVAYPHMEAYSQQIAEWFCTFMRRGDSLVPSLTWPGFDLEKKAAMLFDKTFEVRSDSLKAEPEALGRAAGRRTLRRSALSRGSALRRREERGYFAPLWIDGRRTAIYNIVRQH